MTVQMAVRMDDQEAAMFKAITKALGTTPSDAIRMMVASFNRNGGFAQPMTLGLPAETLEAMAEADRMLEEGTGRFEDADSMFKSLGM
ncbi:MAG: type II toxin-antitoxin system RelB/DinJ family antitoxin [Bifidobacterium sp.]|nr:type II toxin-antitoxin system RelB/DinJ family antitoxin [Bifidobacterium sp.]